MHKKVIGNKSTRFLNENITISVKCYSNSFEITVKLSEISKGNHVKEENEKAHVDLITQKDLKQQVSITRTITYKKDSDKDIIPKKIRIQYTESPLIKGHITVLPEFYLPLVILKQAQTKQTMKQDFPIEIHQKNPRPSSSKFTPYKKTCPSHTYRG